MEGVVTEDFIRMVHRGIAGFVPVPDISVKGAEVLPENLIVEFLDAGDPEFGDKMDDVDLVNCLRCSETMRRFFDISASKLEHEECDEHGKFYDAGEFTVWEQSQYL